MNIDTKKLSIIERLMKVKQPLILDEVDELLQRSEMDARIEESITDIENNNVVSIEQFAKNNQTWLKERRTK